MRCRCAVDAVWGTWYTPAHILGGWTFRLRRRLEADLLREAVALECSPEADEPQPLAVRTDVAQAPEIEASDVAVLEREVAPVAAAVVSDAMSVAELFEESLASGTRERTVFDTIDQLTLF